MNPVTNKFNGVNVEVCNGVKIDINQTSFEGVILEEEVAPSELDLENEIIKFRGPVKIKADISRITNALTVHLTLSASMYANCSRCLDEFEIGFKKNIELNYPVSKLEPVIDLNPDIREEIILDYPITPLCNYNCKGLCPKCGKNLNKGGCSCATT